MRDSSLRPELFGAAQKFLVDFLCFKSSDRLLITTDTAGDPDVIQALSAAAIAADGRPVVLTLPQLPYQGKLADPYLPAPLGGAVDQSDVWIDLTFPYIAGSELHARAMKAGRLRYMLASDMNADGLLRMFGNIGIDRFFGVQSGLDAIFAQATGRTVRITTALGTDVRFTLDKPHTTRPRRATEPGLYTIPGSCTMNPKVESVKGRIVVETVFHEFYTKLAAPIVLDVDGRIRGVSGGGTERALLETALRRAGGGEYGYVIHFTHGLHPAARFTGRSFVEDMRVPGCDAVGLGLPWWLPGGGENHPDAVLSMQSVSIDNEPIIVDGRIVAAGLAEQAAALAPA